MTQPTGNFTPFAEKMRREDLPDIVIDTFNHYYAQLADGKTGFIPEADIEPVETVPDAETFPDRLLDFGQAALSKTVYLMYWACP